MLKTLKNSARNSRVAQFGLAAMAEGRVFDQGKVEIVKPGPRNVLRPSVPNRP